MKRAIVAIAFGLLLSYSTTYAQDAQAPQAVMDAWQAMAQPCAAQSAGGQSGNEASGREEGLADKVCDTVADLTGPILVAAEYSSPYRPAIVWDGGAYGMAWISSIGGYGVEIYFARLAADGTALIPMTRVSTSAGSAYRPAIVWTGTQYAIAWDDTRLTNYEVYLALLDSSGTKVGADIAVTTDDSFNSYRPSIAWDGSGFGIAWADDRDGQYEIYFALLDASGTKTTMDTAITSDDTFVSSYPSMVWTGSEYGIAWQDLRDTNTEIYFARVSATGSKVGVDLRVTNDSGSSQVPVLAWAGTQYGVAWYDTRTTVQDVYFARISAIGVKIGSDVQITSDAASSGFPWLAWTGAEYGVAWQDNRDGGDDEIYFARISSAGAKVGSEVRMTVDGSPSNYPVLAFGSLGYGVAYALDEVNQAVFIGMGCHADTTPPSCPSGLTVTGNSGYGVGLLWEAGVDFQTEVAYHRLYRDEILIGVTTANTYTDSPRPAGTPSYRVSAVNANGWESSGCAIVTVPEPEGGCGSPWTEAVVVSASTGTAEFPKAAWDGSAYGVVWDDNRDGNNEIYFARVAPDGTVLVPATRVTTQTAASYGPSIAWTGTEYGVAWYDTRTTSYDIYFTRLSKDGTKLLADVQITNDANGSYNPSLVWTGSEYGVAWYDTRTTGYDIYFARISAGGAKVGSDVQITSDAGTSSEPSLVWTGQEYGVAWDDSRTTANDIYFARISAAGAKVGSDVQITSHASISDRASLAWNGQEYGVIWEDQRTLDLYFARINSAGVKEGGDVQVTTHSQVSYSANLVWTGSEYAVAWYESREGSYDIYYASLDSNGYKIGSDRRMSANSSPDYSPTLAVGGRGLGLFWRLDTAGDQIRFLGLGCGALDTTPPSCPSSPAETARTSTTVTLSWGPSVDSESDIGHYNIYRDGSVVGATSNLYWTDSSFDPAAGYVYVITATNAAGYESGTCDAVDTADLVPPPCPAGLLIAWNSTTSLTFSWLPVLDAKSGLKQYKVYKNDVFLANVAAGTTTYTDATVSAGTTYSFAVLAEDWAGNLSTGCTAISTLDTVPPPCPGNLLVAWNSGTSLTLSWLASQDTGSGLRQYKVYKNDVFLSNVAAGTTNYTDNGVSAGITYSFAVLAEDWAGNLSAGCDSISVTAPTNAGNCWEANTPAALLTAGDSEYPAAAWDGSAYGVVWQDGRDGNYEIYFARVSAGGILVVPPTRVTIDTAESSSPVIAWSGTEFGIAWKDARTTTSDIYFARMSPQGFKVGGDVQVTSDAGGVYSPSLVWTGTEFGLAWGDNRTTTMDIYFARISADGIKIGSDHQVTSDAAGSYEPSLVWAGTEYGVAWTDTRTTVYDIYFARISAAGVKVGSDVQITNDAGSGKAPSLAWTGIEYGVAWTDSRTTVYDIYFARVSAAGVKIGSDVQITSAPDFNLEPSLVWRGTGYALVWSDLRSRSMKIFGASLDVFGTRVGEELQISDTAYDVRPHLAAGSQGLALVYLDSNAGKQLLFVGWDCGTLDTTPPTCPSSPAETARTSSSVTLAWGPSVDSESGLDQYVIYRDGTQAGNTTNLFWTDSSFDPAAGYVYIITATNAAGYESGGCASVDTSDHIQPSCVGGIQASVAAGTVTLNWVQAWDDKSGVKEYRVYRNGALRSTIAVGTNTFSEAVAAGSTYNYVVETADWAGNTNSGCTSCSVWVYGGTLTLYLTKNADTVNANLDWNDVGITEYVVYRSLSPQTGIEHERVPLSETKDMVLKDGVRLWFYYIQQRE